MTLAFVNIEMNSLNFDFKKQVGINKGHFFKSFYFNLRTR